MADFIRRNTALYALAPFCKGCRFEDDEENCVQCPHGNIRLKLNAVPAADVVEVVRCKDCKHYKEGKLLGPSKFCYFYQIGTGLNTADDDFCSKGERVTDP